ncbi:MAG: hypothetical protein J2P22_13070 [Nocardioides sp.]|nr:hypothetical protein [Nocardioides sp.]
MAEQLLNAVLGVVVQLAVRLGIGLAVVVAVTGLVAWLSPSVRHRLRIVWRYGRNLPWLVAAVLRWPRLAASSGLGTFKVLKPGGRERPVNVPGTKGWRLTPAGFCFVVCHRYGQSVDTVRAATVSLSSGMRGTVRVESVYRRPHRSRVNVFRRDPFTNIPAPQPLDPDYGTRLRVGVVEDGRDYVLDLRTHPHWLCAGSTGSGKSGLQAAILAALAPTPVVVCLIDLKHGVSAEPYRPRASVVAETQCEAVDLLVDLLRLGRVRAITCKQAGVDSVYDLDPHIRPAEVVIIVDEVAELGFEGDTPEAKRLARQAMANLLRCVQLLRAFGIHLIISGQRFGHSLGAQITNIRAQLSGRVCLRVDDDETGAMVIGDITRDAVHAALEIPAHLPGVAVVRGGPDRWQRVRFAHITHQHLASIAHTHAEHRTPWSRVLAECDRLGDAHPIPLPEHVTEDVAVDDAVDDAEENLR